MTTRNSLTGAILGGGLTAGLCDFIYANVFYYLWKGITPVQLWQFVASGLLGESALKGGYATAALGVIMHFTIALLMALAFVLVALRVRWLVRYPIISGLLYGVFLYYFMNGVVLPLSNVPTPPDLTRFPMVGASTINFIGGLLIHAFGVGLPIALFAKRAVPAATARPARTVG